MEFNLHIDVSGFDDICNSEKVNWFFINESHIEMPESPQRPNPVALGGLASSRRIISKWTAADHGVEPISNLNTSEAASWSEDFGFQKRWKEIDLSNKSIVSVRSKKLHQNWSKNEGAIIFSGSWDKNVPLSLDRVLNSLISSYLPFRQSLYQPTPVIL